MNPLHVHVVNLPCNGDIDAKRFSDKVSDITRQGYEIVSSGVNTTPSGYSRAWAILTKPAWLDRKEEPK